MHDKESVDALEAQKSEVARKQGDQTRPKVKVNEGESEESRCSYLSRQVERQAFHDIVIEVITKSNVFLDDQETKECLMRWIWLVRRVVLAWQVT